MHKFWEKEHLGKKPTNNGVSLIELFENNITGNQNKVFWMFIIIDSFDEEGVVFCVKDNRSK